MNLTTQNSWVALKAVGTFRSRVGDTNFKDDDMTYYGIVKQILDWIAEQKRNMPNKIIVKKEDYDLTFALLMKIRCVVKPVRNLGQILRYNTQLVGPDALG